MWVVIPSVLYAEVARRCDGTAAGGGTDGAGVGGERQDRTAGTSTRNERLANASTTKSASDVGQLLV